MRMWRTREGEVLPIHSMGERHLRNAARLKMRVLVGNLITLVWLYSEIIRRFFGGKPVPYRESGSGIPELDAVDEFDTF